MIGSGFTVRQINGFILWENICIYFGTVPNMLIEKAQGHWAPVQNKHFFEADDQNGQTTK